LKAAGCPEFAKLNSDFPWDDFDSQWYYDHNYKVLRDDDRQILETVRDFFAKTYLTSPECHGHGLDVGSGTNLYPALSMLPFCDKITLCEYSASNVSWLEDEIQGNLPSWGSFWNLLARKSPYSSIASPWKMLANKTHVEKGSIFDLPKSAWDIGTMFFAAESISSEPAEFEAAMDSFVQSLRSGAPFAAAFMEGSRGYDVGTYWFPAVDVSVNDIEGSLRGKAKDVRTYRIGLTDKPLRAGYGGMILATGKVM
jgi:hypothetical protein